MLRRRASSPDVPAYGKRITVVHIRAAALLAADTAALLCAWLIAVALASWTGRSVWARDWVPVLTVSGRLYTLTALLVLMGLAMNGQYVRRAAFWEETRVIWRYALLAALANFALNFFLQVTNARTLPVLTWLWALWLVPLARLLTREALIRLGYWWRTVLVVGADDTAWEAAEAIRRERHLGLRIAGFVQTGDAPAPHTRPGQSLDLDPEWAHGLPVYPAQPDRAHSAVSGVELLARRLGCATVVVVLGGAVPPALATLVARLHTRQFEIFTAQTLKGLPVQGIKAQQFFSNDMLFLRLQHRLFNPLAGSFKRGMDVVLAALLLLLLSPLMAWAAWLIWRDDGAPVFYRQTRVGRGKADFSFIKFRTMVRDADARLAAWKTERPGLYAQYAANNFKLADDPRVLAAMRWIRLLSVDELPQLWNVLRGDMSLVGPRPLLPRELHDYPANALTLYAQVRPGITGLWQVSGRSHTSFENRAGYDSWYVRNWSLWVDWIILFKTVRVVLSRRGAM
jgi:undecaprenyl-phosphate galactose phosphotransferase